MAFTGAAVIKKIADNKFRITGLSLAIGASGTIGLAQNAAASDVDITAPGWGEYQTSGTHGGDVTLADAIEVLVIPADAAGTAVEPVAVVKAGTTPADFLATLTNLDAAASGALEIYVTFHG